ncbi:hypothetical protein [Aliikangiella maris]|uniref:Uncharacterized protein n=2 Tax=Aliikangiella maris TaxID=3162458 RepID=A0ABV3MS94_9GAMM
MNKKNYQPHFLQVIFDPISHESPLQAEAIEDIARTNVSNEGELTSTLMKYVKPYFDGFDSSLKEEVTKALEAANSNEFDIENEFDLEELLIERISSNKEFFLRKMKEVLLD